MCIRDREDIENGPWERTVFQEFFHDPALFFDDDGRVYVIYGGGSIHIAELTEDLRAVKPGGVRQLLMETESEGIGLRCEGGHAYKINGMYYLFYICLLYTSIFIDFPSLCIQCLSIRAL